MQGFSNFYLTFIVAFRKFLLFSVLLLPSAPNHDLLSDQGIKQI